MRSPYTDWLYYTSSRAEGIRRVCYHFSVLLGSLTRISIDPFELLASSFLERSLDCHQEFAFTLGVSEAAEDRSANEVMGVVVSTSRNLVISESSFSSSLKTLLDRRVSTSL